ncbi:L-lactate dehydrogenase [Salinibacter ruber]|uniref:L-lactate dehydrogenase n=1 Tax=Salinibacter ruber TaxID=146919 RepID=UPI00216863D4|nr:L-lactate dehydrogenase [Salinibacter ruber]MCS3626991.1 L-lactate dehydrogenase [Salinibacter ruber]MCS4143757.1 L-lactate dehydrogenase [Salinibacter ruber]
MIQRRTVGIVGTGNVGTAAAYAMFNQSLASEILLLDQDTRRAEGEAMDLMHGQQLVGGITCRAVEYAALSNAQIIVLSAGASQQSPDETRLGLLQRNAEIFREIIIQLDKHAPNAILVVATNPVDVLTYICQELSSRPNRRILGTGTLLDTARFRALLGRHYGVDPRSVHAYILGEHGDSEVPIWSNATIGGQKIRGETVLGKEWEEEAMQSIFEQARDAAYEIIDRKGHTDTAIGLVIARIVRAILEDQQNVLPVSTRPDGAYDIKDVCLSIPCVVGLEGVEKRVDPELSADERTALQASAQALHESRNGLDIEP